MAQSLPPAAPLPAWVLKGGLRLTHLSYSRSATAWQALVPASLGIEYRAGSRCSLYMQLDADLQLRNAAAARGRRAQPAAISTTLPAAALGVGSRWYYARPAATTAQRLANAPEFGRYLALEAGTELTQTDAPARGRARAVARRPNWNSAALVSPYVFVRWGVQNRLRPHVLYDLNAGLGIVAPARPAAEYTGHDHRLDVAAQVNVSLYLASWRNPAPRVGNSH